ncbi:MAG: hypothetical protein HYW71_02685 [Candidatus Niyogibacteria bacterium]|nr:hypothetical protein [Candidatus Niyogibacteria bacterium]
MDGEKLKKIKTILNKKNFKLFLRPNPREEEFLAKEALRLALENAGKNVINGEEKSTDLKLKWQEIISLPNSEKSAITPTLKIKIPKKNGIAEASYDEEDDFLVFSITPKSGEINSQEISIQKIMPAPEAIFAFFEKEEELENIQNKQSWPTKENIVLISPDHSYSLIQKINELIGLLGKEICQNKIIATLLFACLIVETENFNKNTSKEILDLAGTFLENGADKETIKKIQFSRPAANQFLGRALARTYADEKTNAAWTFFTEQDFQKTNTQPSLELFSSLVKSFNRVIAEKDRHFLLWKEKGEVKGLLYCRSENGFSFLSRKLGLKPQNNFIRLPDYPNFSAAEKNLRQLLKNSD